MNIDRHTPPVIRYLNRTVVEYCNRYLAGVTGQRLVDAVIDNFHRQVVWAGGVCVHAGAALNRLKPGEDLDIPCLVLIRHFTPVRTMRAWIRMRNSCAMFAGLDSNFKQRQASPGRYLIQAVRTAKAN